MSDDDRFAIPGKKGNFLHYSGTGGHLNYEADFVVVDVETTGFAAWKEDRIVELGAVRLSGDGTIKGSLSTLINPLTGTTGAKHIHGISIDMVENAPTYKQVYDQFADLLDGAVFVAHHAKFDEGFISAESYRAGVKLNRMPGLCTYWLSRQVLQLPNYKLATVTGHYGIDQQLAHSAYDDALVVAKFLPHLINSYGPVEQYVETVDQPRLGITADLLPR
jgi:DNA polymerase III epsilon subunit family exonuclease